MVQRITFVWIFLMVFLACAGILDFNFFGIKAIFIAIDSIILWFLYNIIELSYAFLKR